MTHTAIPSSPGGETDAARGHDAVDRVPARAVHRGGVDTVAIPGTVETLYVGI
jgi:hypothetical protein